LYSLRAYQDSDYDSIVELYNSSTLLHEFDFLNEEQKKVILIVEKDREKINKQFKEGICFVAQNNKNQILGFLSFIFEKNYLNFLYVHNDFHRQGIGLALLQKFEEEAKKKGITKYFFYATPLGISFYRKLGSFIDKGKEEHKIKGVSFNSQKFERKLE
jgi:ribosomal protein S18 acetylase RimI-like enzyme